MVPRQAFIPEARETACPFLLGELPDAARPVFPPCAGHSCGARARSAHFLMNHPEKREPVQVQRHRYKKQGVEGGVLSAALKLGNVNTRETSEISKFLLR